MKYQVGAVLVLLFLATSGFSWGSSDNNSVSKKKEAVETSSAVTENAMPVATDASATAPSSYASSSSSPSAYAPASSADQRATAIRILTSGDEQTRKARMESLSRIARSMAARRQAETTPN